MKKEKTIEYDLPCKSCHYCLPLNFEHAVDVWRQTIGEVREYQLMLKCPNCNDFTDVSLAEWIHYRDIWRHPK